MSRLDVGTRDVGTSVCHAWMSASQVARVSVTPAWEAIPRNRPQSGGGQSVCPLRHRQAGSRNKRGCGHNDARNPNAALTAVVPLKACDRAGECCGGWARLNPLLMCSPCRYLIEQHDAVVAVPDLILC